MGPRDLCFNMPPGHQQLWGLLGDLLLHMEALGSGAFGSLPRSALQNFTVDLLQPPGHLPASIAAAQSEAICLVGNRHSCAAAV